MLRAPLTTRTPWATWVALVALGVVVVAAFLPWAASGRAERSSFALFRVADRLGVLPAGDVATVARSWPLLPFLAAVALAAAAMGWRRCSGLLAALLGAAAAAAASAVVRSPLPALVGAWLALGAGSVAVLAGVVAAVRAPGRRVAPRPVVGPVPATPPTSR